MSINIITGFDGSSPHSDEGVKKLENNKFVIYPSWREKEGIDEEMPGGGSRMYIKIQNEGSGPEELFLTADWETPKRVEHHDYGFIKHLIDDEWTQVTGIHNGETKIDYKLFIKPGVTEFGLLPAYNYEKLCHFIKISEDKGFKSEVIGKSGEGRKMFLLSLKSANPGALNYFIQARDHAYETAGSYCVEGMIEFLASDAFMSEYLRSKYNFYIMPMTNPDGVFKGLSRLTHEKGLNLDRLYWNEGQGPEVDVMIKTFELIKPKVYMNIHNYAMKFIDGLLTPHDPDFVDKVTQHLPADHEHYRRWYIVTDKDWCQKNNTTEILKDCLGGRQYCKEKFGALALAFEFPWFGRNTAMMREKGAMALTALGLAAVEELKI